MKKVPAKRGRSLRKVLAKRGKSLRVSTRKAGDKFELRSHTLRMRNLKGVPQQSEEEFEKTPANGEGLGAALPQSRKRI